MNKKTKKGFTLVELLVVIAILAILATVSVVGYTSFIDKANLSNDQSTIGMINRNLEAEFVTDKPETAGEAVSALYALGFSAEKLVPYSKDFHYVYDLGENKFYLADESGALVYPSEKTDKANVWGLYRDKGALDKTTGVNRYVLTTSPVFADGFEQAFGSGVYTLDLNSHVLILKTESNDANITIKNGQVATDGNFSTNEEDKDTVKKYEQTDSLINGEVNGDPSYNLDSVTSSDTITFTEYAFVGGGQNSVEAYDNLISKIKNSGATRLVFENCVFSDFASINDFGWGAKDDDAIVDVVINECKFVNIYNLSFNTLDKLTITNNEFINCQNGISVGIQAEGSVIEGNSFSLTSTAEGYMVQVVYPTSQSTLAPESATVTVKDNIVKTGRVAVQLYKTQFENCQSAIAFDNNTYPADIIKVASHPSKVADTKDYISVFEAIVK